MAPTTLEPPQVETPVEKKTVRDYEPKPAVPQPPTQSLLVKIFGGHQEYLGWTPD